MKILMLADVYKPVINGVSFSIEIFSSGLRKAGHEVSILVPDYSGAAREENVDRLRSFTFPFHREQRLALPFPRKTMARILKKEWDVIHVHTLFNLGFLGLWIARRKKIPAVFTYHTLFEEYVHYIPLPETFMKKLAVFWSRSFCNACNAVISPSEEIKKVLIDYQVKKPIAVLPTPIDPGSFLPVSNESPYEKKLGLSREAKICLYVGRIGPEKNLDFLLRAFARINTREPLARLVIVGDGPYRRAMEKTSMESGLNGKVFFAGYVPRNELGTWFSKAALFLFASVTETQGMALAEALLFGLPAVIVDGSGTREVVQDGVNGYITPKNEEAFAEKALTLLWNDQLLTAFSSQAFRSVEKLKLERIVQALVEVYEKTDKEIAWKKR